MKNTSSEAPGFNSIRTPVDAVWSVTNTTAGRHITFAKISGVVDPVAGPDLMLAALWPVTSDVCTYSPTIRPGTNGSCSIVLSSIALPDTLSASQTATPTVFTGGIGVAPGVAKMLTRNMTRFLEA